MPRSVHGRRDARQNVRRAQVRQGRFRTQRELPASGRGRHAPCLIGLPLNVTVPKIKNVRWRYCARCDEKPAATLGGSLLRLGICRAEDWTGSAIDFVERGFNRFCQANGATEARKIWEGDLRVTDQLFALTERERNEASAEMAGPPQKLFLLGDFSAAASIPIGATLPHLEREHELLPAAFYAVFGQHLCKWMRIYDCRDALEYAEMGMIDMDEEQLQDSCYPRVKTNIPACLARRLKMNPARALALLKEVQPRLRGSTARQLLGHLLDMHKNSSRYRHAWPSKSLQQIPGLEEFLEDSDGVGPGALICWYEGDAISACFEEEMSYMGQNGPLAPSILLAITPDQPSKTLDRQVKHIFDYAGAMLRSLASAAKIVEIIRELYDECLREHRLQSGLQAQPGSSGIREE
jgi:hypothetical protein